MVMELTLKYAIISGIKEDQRCVILLLRDTLIVHLIEVPSHSVE
jgi:hypothetical protein